MTKLGSFIFIACIAIFAIKGVNRSMLNDDWFRGVFYILGATLLIYALIQNMKKTATTL